MIVGRAGDDDAAGLGQLLETRRDVHAIAEKVAFVGDHVAKIDADAQADALVLGNRRFALRHALLRGDGAGHGIDDAAELAQRSIAHELDDAATVLGDQRLDEALAVLLQTLERARLVALDQPRIADHVGRQNGSEATVDAGGGHGVTSIARRFNLYACGCKRCKFREAASKTSLQPQGKRPKYQAHYRSSIR